MLYARSHLDTEEDTGKQVNSQRGDDEKPDDLEEGSSKVYNSVVLDDPVSKESLFVEIICINATELTQ